MSLGLVVVVRHGIILIADSRTTTIDPANQARIATDFTDKLFRCGKYGIVTAGRNDFTNKTVGQHVTEFCSTNTARSIDDVARDLASHFYALYVADKTANPACAVPAGNVVITFVIAGYTGKDSSALQVFVHEPDAINTTGMIVKEIIAANALTVGWLGDYEFVQRLVNGHSTANLTPAQVAALPQVQLGLTTFKNFTFQDAVNYGVFLCQVTMKMQRFTQSSSPILRETTNVGGALDVAKVTAAGGFEWIQQKKLAVTDQLSPDNSIVVSAQLPNPPKSAKKH